MLFLYKALLYGTVSLSGKKKIYSQGFLGILFGLYSVSVNLKKIITQESPSPENVGKCLS